MLDKDTKRIFIKGADFEAIFDPQTGSIYSLKYGDETVISDGNGPKLDALRAFTNNDNWFYAPWFEYGLHNLQHKMIEVTAREKDSKMVLSFTVESQAPNAASIKGGTSSGKNSIVELTDRKFGANDFKFITNQVWTVYPDGSIELQSSITSTRPSLTLPRLGYVMKVPQEYANFTYYGRGPIDNYADRKSGQFIEQHTNTVAGEFVNFPKPQDMGNHEDVRWISITNPDGIGFVFVAGDKMSASALHARAQDMVDPANRRRLLHKYEVPMRKETVLCLDAQVRPLGNASCGPGPMQKYELRSQPTVFSFIMLPLERSYSKEELVKKARVQMPVCMPVLIERDNNGYLNLQTSTPGATIHYSLNGGEDKIYDGPFELISGGNVEAYAISEQLAKSVKSSAKLPIYVDRSTWKIVSVSSENGGEEARNAIDGDLNTIWHSRWNDPVAKHPHEIVVDMSSLLEIDKFIYQPRNSENGRIKDYELYFSQDGKNWGNKMKGSFENSASAQFVTLEKPIVTRYFKLIALSEIYGRDWASAAELNVNAIRNLSGVSGGRQKVVYVDSDADGSMKLAADGDMNTYWHTVHNQFYLAPYPHEIQIGLTKETVVKGIKYTPRQDAAEGRIAKYEVYVSRDGKEWGKAVTSGTFADSKEVQTIEFTPCKARYVKLQALSSVVKDGKMAAVAELEVLLDE